MQETQVRSLGQEGPLEKEVAIHSSTVAWKIQWMEGHNIVQEAEIKIISKKKKCKKAKWLSEEDLQAAEKTREVKGKGKIFPSECRVPETSKEE